MKVRAGWQKHGSWYWVRPGFRPTATNKAENREIFYNQIVIRLMKTMLRFQGIQMSVAGSENLPDTGGALLALNHTGYFDFIFGGTAANLHGRRLVRFMAKKEVFDVLKIDFSGVASSILKTSRLGVVPFTTSEFSSIEISSKVILWGTRSSKFRRLCFKSAFDEAI